MSRPDKGTTRVPIAAGTFDELLLATYNAYAPLVIRLTERRSGCSTILLIYGKQPARVESAADPWNLTEVNIHRFIERNCGGSNGPGGSLGERIHLEETGMFRCYREGLPHP